MECRVELLQSFTFPASTLSSLIQISWSSNSSTSAPQTSGQKPATAQPASSENDKAVTILRCRAHAVGWVRIHNKQGSFAVKGPEGSSVCSPAGPLSPFLTAKFHGDREAGRLEQIFYSGDSEVLSNAVLRQGETRNFRFDFTLPPILCPSFKGKCFSILYAIVVETQLAGVGNIVPEPSLVSLPFRVVCSDELSVKGLGMEIYGPAALRHDFRAQVKPVELEILNSQSLVPTGLNSSHEEEHQQMGGGGQRFAIRRGKDLVTTFRLPEQRLRCGETVLGFFDFSEATAQCKKIVASLESLETLSPMLSTSVDPAKASGPSQGTQQCSRTLATPHCVDSNVVLAIPLLAPPSLTCPLGTVSWVLRVQLLVAKQQSGTEVEELNWSLPLKVLRPMLGHLAHADKQSKAGALLT